MKGARYIPGFGHRYMATRDGQIFSFFIGRFLKLRVHHKNNYPYVRIREDGSKTKTWRTYKLVMRAFAGMPPANAEVDHKNRTRTDTRRANLRYVTRSMNRHNRLAPKKKFRTKFRGVTFYAHSPTPRPWVAKVGCRETFRWGGRHATDIEAALAYDKLALKTYGPTAVTNKSLGLL